MRTKTGAVLTAFTVFAAITTVAAQDAASNEDAIQSRIRALEQELQNLKQTVDKQQTRTNENTQFEELDQKVRVLERKQELANEEAAAKAKTTPILSVGERGFSLQSADGAFNLRLRSLVQADTRLYFGEGNASDSDTFLIRRARIELTGKLFEKFDYRLMEDFAGSSPTLLDAWLKWNPDPRFQLVAGKSKLPVDLEREQSREYNLTTEFGYPTSLAPNRSIGVAARGLLLGGILDYYIGGFNSTADGGSSVTAASGSFSGAGRLFVQPFLNSGNSALKGIGFGVGGTYGEFEGTPSGYSTVGQRPFFSWNAGVVDDGTQWRLLPQIYYFNGPFGLLAEYAISSQQARSGANQATLENRAWQATASWVLTGEDATFNGVKPKHPFGFGENRGWGAWQVVARATELDVDNDAFPTFANPASSASKATSYGGGLNWYLNPMTRISADYNWTTFAGATRPDENSFIMRFQFRF